MIGVTSIKPIYFISMATGKEIIGNWVRANHPNGFKNLGDNALKVCQYLADADGERSEVQIAYRLGWSRSTVMGALSDLVRAEYVGIGWDSYWLACKGENVLSLRTETGLYTFNPNYVGYVTALKLGKLLANTEAWTSDEPPVVGDYIKPRSVKRAKRPRKGKKLRAYRKAKKAFPLEDFKRRWEIKRGVWKEQIPQMGIRAEGDDSYRVRIDGRGDLFGDLYLIDKCMISLLLLEFDGMTHYQGFQYCKANQNNKGITHCIYQGSRIISNVYQGESPEDVIDSLNSSESDEFVKVGE